MLFKFENHGFTFLFEVSVVDSGQLAFHSENLSLFSQFIDLFKKLEFFPVFVSEVERRDLVYRNLSIFYVNN